MLYNFFLKNSFLIISFFILIFVLFVLEINFFLNSKNFLNSFKIIELINHENALLIDIRSESDFLTFHILNSINIPFDKLLNNIIKLKKYKLKTVIIIHSNNNLSIKAINFFRENEFVKVFSIEGGISSWVKNNLPIKRG